MKYLLSFCLFIVFAVNSLDAQVTELKYLLKYNCETNNYDVMIKIMEGSATSILERVQFNSQLTILIPTGMSFEIVDRYQPLENNQMYDGTVPNEWSTFSPVISPQGHEKYDFYSVAPKLAPASFFNNLEEGEEVAIFSFAVSGEQEYDDRIRFFDNSIDKKLSMFEGADLRNGYSIGGATNRYNGNIHQDCTSTNTNNIIKPKAKIYPNPSNNIIFIEASEDTKNIKMIDTFGSIIKEIKRPISGSVYSIDVENLTGGIYFIQLDNGILVNTEQVLIF